MIVAPNRTPQQDRELACAIKRLLANDLARYTPSQSNTDSAQGEWTVRDFVPAGDESRISLTERLGDLRAHRSTKAGAKHIVRSFGQLSLAFYLQGSKSALLQVSALCRQSLMFGLIPTGDIPENLTVGFTAALIDAAWEALAYGRRSPVSWKPQEERLNRATELFLSPFSVLSEHCYGGDPFGATVKRMIDKTDNRSSTPVGTLNRLGLQLAGSSADIDTFYRFATMTTADACLAMIGLLIEHGGPVAPAAEAYREVKRSCPSPEQRKDALVLREHAHSKLGMELFPEVNPAFERQRRDLLKPLSALQACGAFSEAMRPKAPATALHKRLYEHQPAA